jgi:hypothetical protein
MICEQYKLRNMNKFIYIIIGAFLLTSCDDFLDVNDNPNSPVSENLVLSAKLPAALVYTAVLETGQLNQLGAFWGGYIGTTSEAVTKFRKERTYNGPSIMAARDGIPVWENGYQALLYYQLIKEQAHDENSLFYLGMARIMQGFHFMRLVEVYGDVAFDQALQGTKYPQPAYEDGEMVYAKSIDLITTGIENIKNAPVASGPGNADVMFGGNAQLWVKFGNTLKLRALLRQSEVANSDYITSEIDKITQEGSGFLGVGEHVAVQPGYLNTSGKTNPFWTNYYRTIQGVYTGNHIDLAPTQFIIDRYSELNDPRLHNLYTLSEEEGIYKGVLFGNPSADAGYGRKLVSMFKGPIENNNKPAALFKSATQASVIMGSFESLFLQAEAAHRGWIRGSAAAFYNDAIKESFRYMEVTDAIVVATYLAQDAVTFNNSLEQIVLQKWLALNFISSIEAWNDFRRLGLPAIPNSLSAPSANARPQRLMYPETEEQSNGSEVNKRGVTDITVAKVWWMR